MLPKVAEHTPPNRTKIGPVPTHHARMQWERPLWPGLHQAVFTRCSELLPCLMLRLLRSILVWDLYTS
eukprot:15454413-Alexandrium_andersonii.AAC.1